MSFVSVIELDHNPSGICLHGRLQHRGAEGDPPAQPLWGVAQQPIRAPLFYSFNNPGAHPAGRNTQEKPRTYSALLIHKRDSTNIDSTRATGAENPGRVSRLRRYLQTSAKVSSGATRQNPELDILARFENAIGYF
jgi:hypothetical protein